ncbi:MAG: SDR family oxidoreductase [Pirellulales bacterium]
MPVAVITGSSSGIGLATAHRFVAQGYSVVLHGKSNLSGLQQAAKQLLPLLGSGCDIFCITADVGCSLACKSLVQACFNWKNGVDVWVNNAGADVLTGESSKWGFDEKLELLLAVDLKGTIRLSRLVADRMLAMPQSKQLRSIINISWDQAQLGMEDEPGQLFCTIKAAIAAFSTSLALSVSPSIRVNTVAPGWIRTAWGDDEASSYWDRRATNESQLQRWGRADDVAATICWLASSEAEFICGQTINVNGGRRYYPSP